MRCWYFLALIVALAFCFRYVPHSGIAWSAQDAFDSSGSRGAAPGIAEYLPAPTVPRERQVASTSTPVTPRRCKRGTPFISTKSCRQTGVQMRNVRLAAAGGLGGGSCQIVAEWWQQRFEQPTSAAPTMSFLQAPFGTTRVRAAGGSSNRKSVLKRAIE